MNNQFRTLVKLVVFGYFLLAVYTSCTNPSHHNQNRDDNIENISDKIKSFDTDEIDLHSWSDIICSGGKIFVTDSKAVDSIIAIFDASTLRYQGLIAKLGSGPEEITVPGALQYNDISKDLLIFDYGQMIVKAYNLDSALTHRPYVPHKVITIPANRIPDRYVGINDSTGIARLIIMPDKSSGEKGYAQTLCHYNIVTGETIEIENAGRQDKLKTIFAINKFKDRIIECGVNNDIITIYNLKGDKIRDIFGPKYDNDDVVKSTWFYTHVTASNKYIFALYSGNDDVATKSYGRYIYVYDLDGNFIITLDPGMLIAKICYDNTQNRLILTCENADVQLAYINLNDIESLM